MGATILTDCTVLYTTHNICSFYLNYFGSDLFVLKEIQDMENLHHAVLYATCYDW
jgi:hypothetical protein